MNDAKFNMYQPISSFCEKIKSYPIYREIENKMKEAQEKIGYTFRNIFYLAFAFCRVKLEITNASYQNDTLAQIGDSVLDLVIIERGFADGKNKKKIDDNRQKNAKNTRLKSFLDERALQQFCYHEKYFYNDAPKNDQVSSGKHDAIVEAIIGAIYLDGGLEEARSWITKNILRSKDTFVVPTHVESVVCLGK